MYSILFVLLIHINAGMTAGQKFQERPELKTVKELFRLRNEGKPDSAEQYYADTVLVYMKDLRNVPKETITRLDRIFFKNHPKNKFEIVKPIEIIGKGGITSVIIIGKEYLDGTSFKYERIEIRFDLTKKINYFRAFNLKKIE